MEKQRLKRCFFNFKINFKNSNFVPNFFFEPRSIPACSGKRDNWPVFSKKVFYFFPIFQKFKKVFWKNKKNKFFTFLRKFCSKKKKTICVGSSLTVDGSVQYRHDGLCQRLSWAIVTFFWFISKTNFEKKIARNIVFRIVCCQNFVFILKFLILLKTALSAPQSQQNWKPHSQITFLKKENEKIENLKNSMNNF